MPERVGQLREIPRVVNESRSKSNPQTMNNIWHPINRPPDEPAQVELFFGNAPYEGDDARWPKDMRRQIGYWDGKTWREMGTNHEVFESWKDQCQLPTHWRMLCRDVPAMNQTVGRSTI
jgi:hypothetical protein